MQTRNKIMEDISQLMTNAMGVAQGAKEEAETAMKSLLDRWLADRDFVTREEFDAVRAMAQKAREENEALKARIAALEAKGVPTRVQSAIPMATVCEPYIRRRATRHMEKGRIVIFAAGTGNPFFTTDTAAALRASEMDCDAMLKATKVDGVYSADPMKDSTAKRYDRLSYHQVLTDDLQVMDASAITLSRERNIPILVFSLYDPGAFAKVVCGQGRFTIVTDAV